jgi:hypothetical protein
MPETSFIETNPARALRDRIKLAENAYTEALLELYHIRAGGARFDRDSNGSRVGHPLNPLYMDLLAAIEEWRMYTWREAHHINAWQHAA